jgi:hypothetical protein
MQGCLRLAIQQIAAAAVQVLRDGIGIVVGGAPTPRIPQKEETGERHHHGAHGHCRAGVPMRLAIRRGSRGLGYCHELRLRNSRYIRSGGQLDRHRVLCARAGIILRQLRPQVMRLYTHDGIHPRIEIGVAIEDAHAQGVFLNFRTAARQRLLHQVSQQAGQTG